MKALPSVLLAAALVLIGLQPSGSAQSSQTCYMVADGASGYMLASSNPNRKVQVGSLTKVATAMVVLDWADLQKRDLGEIAVVPPTIVTLTGTNPIGFQPGDSATLRDLLYAALLQSDNAAAMTLAWHVGKTLPSPSPDVEATPVDRFVAQMNALARKLNMTHTLFLNPHGLDSAETKLPYSSAADMARLARYAMDRPGFRFFVSQKERRINITHVAGGLAAFSLVNTNELLGYNGVDGVKTGRTRRAGECVIISASRAPDSRKDGDNYIITPRRLIVVVLGADQRFSTASQLLENGWKRHEAWEAAGRPVKKGQTL